jgi:hypothetical protein
MPRSQPTFPDPEDQEEEGSKDQEFTGYKKIPTESFGNETVYLVYNGTFFGERM